MPADAYLDRSIAELLPSQRTLWIPLDQDLGPIDLFLGQLNEAASTRQ